MTFREMHAFALKQIDWYEKQNTFARKQIDFCNRELKRTRKDDAELKTFALARDPDDRITREVFGGKYVGQETRKYINERARWYRDIKRNNSMIERYRKSADRYAGLDPASRAW